MHVINVCLSTNRLSFQAHLRLNQPFGYTSGGPALGKLSGLMLRTLDIRTRLVYVDVSTDSHLARSAIGSRRDRVCESIITTRDACQLD